MFINASTIKTQTGTIIAVMDSSDDSEGFDFGTSAFSVIEPSGYGRSTLTICDGSGEPRRNQVIMLGVDEGELYEAARERARSDNRGDWFNVYEMEQCYGGPEEGGWWYDRLHPVNSVEVSSLPEGRRRALWRAMQSYETRENAGRRAYTSVLSEGNLVCQIEEYPGHLIDRETPHYE